MQMSDRIDGFRGKLPYWRESLSKANFTPLPQMSPFLKDNRIDERFTLDVQPQGTPRRAPRLFPDVDMSKFDWVIDHFTVMQVQWILHS